MLEWTKSDVACSRSYEVEVSLERDVKMTKL